MNKKRLRVPETAKIMGLCVQRIFVKLKRGHFPNHEWCECGKCILIPIEDVNNDLERIKKSKRKKNKPIEKQ